MHTHPLLAEKAELLIWFSLIAFAKTAIGKLLIPITAVLEPNV